MDYDLGDGGDDSVWSPDIEQAFDEALQIYPPCGRRKIILTEENRMFGRNELIARYIKMKTGKTRSRKQVSSHIQVLARKKQREIQTKIKENPEAAQQLAESLSGLSSAEIVSTAMPAGSPNSNAAAAAAVMAAAIAVASGGGAPQRHMTFSGTPSKEKQDLWADQAVMSNVLFPDAYVGNEVPVAVAHHRRPQPQMTYNGIARIRLALDHFSAYIEYPLQQGVHEFISINGSYHFADPAMEIIDILQVYDKFPALAEMYRQGPQEAFFLVKIWVNMAFNTDALRDYVPPLADNPTLVDPQPPFFGMSYNFESLESMAVEISTSAISMGKQVMEKVQTVLPMVDGGRYIYVADREPMCQYLITFIQRLRQLDNIEFMNRVLDNFFVTQTVKARDTGEVLFSMACVFEVAQPGQPSSHHVYKLMFPAEEIYRRYTA